MATGQGAATRHVRCHGKEPQRRTVGKPSGIGELVRANPLQGSYRCTSGFIIPAL
ncbi:MAG TPA: hypothetical protein VIG66_01085 [Noviherbaspirillum sp.]